MTSMAAHTFTSASPIDAPHLPLREGPPDPARVPPLHLPAVHHVASDLDGIDAPIKIVDPTELGACTACLDEHGRLDDPLLGAIATVVAYQDGFRFHLAVCALHMSLVVRHYNSHGWPTLVEVPTCSRQWFERSTRETYYALDEDTGIAVTRTTLDVWAVWQVSASLALGAPLALFPADQGDAQSRLVAECWAQAYAARLAADAYESGFVIAETVALPLVAVTEVAA